MFVQRIAKVVAFGENQRSTCEAKVKSFKSIQIFQIFFVRILKNNKLDTSLRKILKLPPYGQWVYDKSL